MALRAAVAGQTSPAHTSHPYRPATPLAAAVQAATSRPYAGPLSVECLARPATDFSVIWPDLAQHTPTDVPPAATRSARCSARVGDLPALRVPTGTGPLALALGVGLDRATRGFASARFVGRSTIPVHAVTGTRSLLSWFR